MDCPPLTLATVPCLILALAAAAARPASAGNPTPAAGPTVLDIGSRKQLLIDTLFLGEANGVALRVHPPRKTGEIALKRDKPWESATLNWFGVLQEGKRCRMWYEAYDAEGWPTADDTSFCYAESTDGVHWTKPDLGICTYQADTHTNILFRQIGTGASRSRVHGANVFVDPGARPNERYKAVSQGIFAGLTPPHRIAGMISPDGIRWTRLPAPICDVFADSQYSGFWDPALREYVLYGRVSGRGRAIGRSESADFAHFAPPALVMQTDEQDPPDTDLYNPAAVRYAYAESVYLAFPSLYEHKTHTLDIRLAVSRDGVHWSFPERVPYIPLGRPGTLDSGSLYMGQGMLRHGDTLSLYYSGARINHEQAELETLTKPEGERVFLRATTPLDRFVSATAGPSGGSFVTPPLRFRGSKLVVNVLAAKGSASFALLDAQGRPLPGFTLDACEPVRGDTTRATVRWKAGANVNRLAGKPIRLRVSLRNASLFTFAFVP